MTKKQHVQCLLHKGTAVMTAWIPKECARVDHVVDLDDPEHGEAKGWTVVEVGTTALDSKWVSERCGDHLNHRKTTDI
jgi:hypothetical protein